MDNSFKELDLFIRARASMADDRIEDPSEELGDDDSWLLEKFHAFLEGLDGVEYVSFISRIIDETREKYKGFDESAFVVQHIVSDVLHMRPTKKYNGKFPDDLKPVELSKSEEKSLKEILNLIKDALPEAHKYRVKKLMDDMF